MGGRRRWRGVVASLACAAIAAAGCSGNGDDTATTSSSSTTTTTSPSTTTTGTASTTSTTAAATVDTTGVEGPAEWVPVVADVYGRIHRLDVSPDPARIVEVFSENYSELSKVQTTQQFLVDNGLHAEGPPPHVIRVDGPTDESGGTFQFTVTIEYSPFDLVRADGSVYQSVTDVPGRVQELLRISPSGANGAYRVLVKEAV